MWRFNSGNNSDDDSDDDGPVVYGGGGVYRTYTSITTTRGNGDIEIKRVQERGSITTKSSWEATPKTRSYDLDYTYMTTAEMRRAIEARRAELANLQEAREKLEREAEQKKQAEQSKLYQLEIAKNQKIAEVKALERAAEREKYKLDQVLKARANVSKVEAEIASSKLRIKNEEKKFKDQKEAKDREYNKIEDILSKLELQLKDRTGSGLKDHEESYWYEYSKAAMDNILSLRMNQVDESELDIGIVKVLKFDWVWDGSSDSKELLTEEILSKCQEDVGKFKIVGILNLYCKHWVAVGIEIDKANGIVGINYMDSEHNDVPNDLLETLFGTMKKIFSNYKVIFYEKEVELQKYNNCGLEAVENLIDFIAGSRVDQDNVLNVHSWLVERELLGADSLYGSVES